MANFGLSSCRHPRFSRSARFVRLALVDGAPGLAIRLPGRTLGALGFIVDGEVITEIDMISDRARLRHVDLTTPHGLA